MVYIGWKFTFWGHRLLLAECSIHRENNNRSTDKIHTQGTQPYLGVLARESGSSCNTCISSHIFRIRKILKHRSTNRVLFRSEGRKTKRHFTLRSDMLFKPNFETRDTPRRPYGCCICSHIKEWL